MKTIVSLLLGCICLISIGNTMDKLNIIDDLENNKSQTLNITNSGHKDNINKNKIINSLLNNNQFLMIYNINKKILREDANKICNQFNINYDILSEYKQYWRQLEYYIQRINKEVKSNKNEILEILLLSGKLSLNASDIKFRIKNKLNLCENNDIEFLKIINSEQDLYGINIFKVIYSLADEIPSLILYCQSLYPSDECYKQLDNICKLLRF